MDDPSMHEAEATLVLLRAKYGRHYKIFNSIPREPNFASGMSEDAKAGASSTEYALIGPTDWVDQRVAALMEQYHPLGYGTSVVRNIEKDGIKHVVVRRANSCD